MYAVFPKSRSGKCDIRFEGGLLNGVSFNLVVRSRNVCRIEYIMCQSSLTKAVQIGANWTWHRL